MYEWLKKEHPKVDLVDSSWLKSDALCTPNPINERLANKKDVFFMNIMEREGVHSGVWNEGVGWGGAP